MSYLSLTDGKLHHRGGVGSVCVQNLMFLALPFSNLGGVPKFKNSTQDSQDSHHALGYFVIPEMKNTKIYPYTKFEVTSFTHSELREGVPKLKISVPHHHDPTLGVFCHP